MNIGEVSKASGVSERMIRHYEKLGLIPPAPRRESGYRNYSPVDVQRLMLIAAARDLGFAMPDVADLVSLCCGTNGAQPLARGIVQRLDRKLALLELLRTALVDANAVRKDDPAA